MFAILRGVVSPLPAIPPYDRVAAALDGLRASPICAGRIVHEEVLPARPARLAAWPQRLHPALVAALRQGGVERPYTHQAEAVEAVLGGRDVVVVTPTAS